MLIDRARVVKLVVGAATQIETRKIPGAESAFPFRSNWLWFATEVKKRRTE